MRNAPQPILLSLDSAASTWFMWILTPRPISFRAAHTHTNTCTNSYYYSLCVWIDKSLTANKKKLGGKFNQASHKLLAQVWLFLDGNTPEMWRRSEDAHLKNNTTPPTFKSLMVAPMNFSEFNDCGKKFVPFFFFFFSFPLSHRIIIFARPVRLCHWSARDGEKKNFVWIFL